MGRPFSHSSAISIATATVKPGNHNQGEACLSPTVAIDMRHRPTPYVFQHMTSDKGQMTFFKFTATPKLIYKLHAVNTTICTSRPSGIGFETDSFIIPAACPVNQGARQCATKAKTGTCQAVISPIG